MRARKRHVLEPFLAQVGEQGTDDGGVVLAVAPFRGFLNLRGNPEDQGFVEAASGQLGQPLPMTGNTFTEGGFQVYWLGPDEWLVMTEPGEDVELEARLESSLAGGHWSLTNLTGNQICVRLSGDKVREALAKGCTLDLHPRVFKPGQCAQTVLGKASMLIALSGTSRQPANADVAGAGGASKPADNGEVFTILLRRSFADYGARWLYHSALEYGVSVTVS